MRWLDELIGLPTLVIEGIARIRRTTTELVAGAGVALESADDPVTKRTIVTIAATGGTPGPSLNAFHLGGDIDIDVAANGALELRWPVGDEQSARAQIPLPEGYAGDEDVLIELWVRSGTEDAATFEIGTSWGTAAEVVDTAVDSSPAATVHKITATIAAADIPADAAYLTLRLTPGEHGVDEVRLRNVYLHL
jgi:hypothetical protein